MKKGFLVAVLLFCIGLLTGVADAKSACFVVTAFNEFGESEFSEEVCCDMVAVGTIATLTWNAVAGATGYNLYYRPPWQSSYIKSKSVTVTTNDPVSVYAMDIFKIDGIPVLGVQCEEPK